MGTDTVEPFDPDVAETYLNHSDDRNPAYTELLLRRAIHHVRELEIREARLTWVSALRSGRYAQGEAHLRSSNDKYCCLGVAHEVLGGEWTAELDYGTYRTVRINAFGLDGSGSAGILEHPAFERLGLNHSDHSTLTRLNDIHKLSFQDIADVVEGAGTNPGDIATFVEELEHWFLEVTGYSNRIFT